MIWLKLNTQSQHIPVDEIKIVNNQGYMKNLLIAAT
jgi:hypothetical protein